MSSATADIVYADLGPHKRRDATGDLKVLVEAIVDHLAVVDELARDTVDHPGWSLLVDVDRVPRRYLPWLAQTVGVDFKPNLTELEERDLLREAPSRRRGTVAYLRAIGQTYLTGNKVVNIVERDDSPYHFTVNVYFTEVGGRIYHAVKASYPTYDAWSAAEATYGSVADNRETLEAALRAQKPGGLLMDFNVIEGATYDELDTEFTDYDAMDAALPTYYDQRFFVP